MIHWELSKKFKFDHMNNTECGREKETLKLLWDFEIQTDHLISARRTDLMIVNTKKKKKKKKREKKKEKKRKEGTNASMLSQKSRTFPSVSGQMKGRIGIFRKVKIK